MNVTVGSGNADGDLFEEDVKDDLAGAVRSALTPDSDVQLHSPSTLPRIPSPSPLLAYRHPHPQPCPAYHHPHPCSHTVTLTLNPATSSVCSTSSCLASSAVLFYFFCTSSTCSACSTSSACSNLFCYFCQFY